MIDTYEIGTKIKESVRERGVIGTVGACLRSTLNPILEHQEVINYQERRFDRKFGVDTAGIIRHEDLKITGPSAAHAIHYQATPTALLQDSLAGLQIDYREYTFVDFGCGKGKALLLASSFPFKEIVGVELSPRLAEIAATNVKKYKSKKQQCRSLAAMRMDAVDFQLPDTPLVCFFYNPFKEQIMARVLKNIEDSIRRRPRDLIVVYFYPLLERLFREKDFLVNTKKRPWCAIYRSVPRRRDKSEWYGYGSLRSA